MCLKLINRKCKTLIIIRKEKNIFILCENNIVMLIINKEENTFSSLILILKMWFLY